MKVEIDRYNPLLEAVRFVSKARAKDSSRYAIQYVKIEEDMLLATDGHRLHIAHVKHPWEPGFYEVLKNNQTKMLLLRVDTDLKFPTWQDVIPRHNTYMEFLTYGGWGSAHVEHYAAALGKHNIVIHHDYLVDALGTRQDWRLFYGSEVGRPIRLVATIEEPNSVCWLEATIMPINPRELNETSKTERRHARKLQRSA